MRYRFMRTAAAASVAITLAAITVAAQASGRSGPSAATGPIGALTLEGVADAPFSVYGFGFEASVLETSQPQITDIRIVRRPDAGSPTLFQLTVLGRPIRSARLDLYTNGGQTIASSYKLVDVKVRGFSTGNETEEIALNFVRIEVAAGGNTICYDVAAGKEC